MGLFGCMVLFFAPSYSEGNKSNTKTIIFKTLIKLLLTITPVVNIICLILLCVQFYQEINNHTEIDNINKKHKRPF